MSANASASPPEEPDADADPLVSAIVSTYDSESFIRGAIEDLERQTIAPRLEIIVVDSGSTQNEGAIIRKLQERHENIRYLRTAQRETIYAAWNRGVEAARGRYLTNANTDDRHRRDALELLSGTLDAHPEVALVYADSLITATPHETFESTTAERVFRWPEFSLRQALGFSIFGPQPMWRRSAHQTRGQFDPAYVVAGDYDFFLGVAWKLGALHVPEALGLYYLGPGVEQSNGARCETETRQILAKYRSAIPIEDIYPALRSSANRDADRGLAEADFANTIMVSAHLDYPLAEQHYRSALADLGRTGPLVNNLAVVRYLRGATEEYTALLDEATSLGDATAEKNRSVLCEHTTGRPDLVLAAVHGPCLEALPPLLTGHAIRTFDKENP